MRSIAPFAGLLVFVLAFLGFAPVGGPWGLASSEVWLHGTCLRAAISPGPQEEEPAPQEPDSRDGKDAEKTGTPQGIPEIPKDQLPPRTRAAPDPATAQYEKPAIWVSITEEAKASDGEAFEPEVRVVERYMAEYFRRAGHPVVDDPAKAALRLEGHCGIEFANEIKFKEDTIGWQYESSSEIRLLDADGRELQRIPLADVIRENVKSEKSAIWDMRRYVARLFYEHLFQSDEGRFANQKVLALLRDLTIDPFESESPKTGDEIVLALADIGLPAVPFLIDALTDTRTVLVEARYPELEILSDLKVYHLADKALEEIFQKISRMDLQTPDHHRFVIIRGWENEWRRFCPSFRDSPQASLSRQAGPETSSTEEGAESVPGRTTRRDARGNPMPEAGGPVPEGNENGRG